MSSLFMYSDKSLVFCYFLLFGLSAIMFSFLISTFFSRAKTAVAVGTLSFLGAFFPYYTVNDPSVPMLVFLLISYKCFVVFFRKFWVFRPSVHLFVCCTVRLWKVLASLLSPTAFALGTVNFADYERAHVGVRWTNMWEVVIDMKKFSSEFQLIFSY